MDELLRRRLMMQPKGGGGDRYVAWIGTPSGVPENLPKIDTPYTFGVDFDTMKCKFRIKEIPGKLRYICAGSRSGLHAGLWFGYEESCKIRVGNNWGGINVADYELDTWYEAIYTKNSVTINGTQVSINATSVDTRTTGIFYTLGVSEGSPLLDIAFVQFYSGDTVIFDGKPYVNKDDVAGLMDDANGLFYPKSERPLDFLYGETL